MGSSAPDATRGDDAAGAGPSGAGAGLVAEAVAELYGTDPQEFTDRRKALSAAAKAAGDTAAARQIAALRKPTRAAWVVNSLARADPGAADRLASLAAALRGAEQAKDGPRLRELSAARGPLIDTLTGQALAAAGVADPPAGLRDEVAATLTAALADPEVAAAFTAGTLTRAAEWAGFGLAMSGADADDTEPFATAEPAARPVPLRQGRGMREDGRAQALAATESGRTTEEETAPPTESGEQDGLAEAGPLRLAGKGSGRRGQPAGERPLRLAGSGSARPEEPAEEGAVRLAGDAERRRERLAAERAARLAEQAAEEAARAADRRQEIFEDAERAVASAAAAAADAVALEDRLEAEVRDLEARLTQARADLAETRLRARRAEIAERKARQVLDRLRRPDARE